MADNCVIGHNNSLPWRLPTDMREGVHVVHDLEAGLVLAEQQCLVDGQDEVMIIGGADIYALALPLATRLYVTFVHTSPPGDVYFPDFDLDDWRCVAEEAFAADDRHSAPFTIAVYERA